MNRINKEARLKLFVNKLRTIRVVKVIWDYLKYIPWVLKGKPIPPHHFSKRRDLIKIGKEYDCKTFLETGTYLGEMVNAVRKHFSLVLSVEIDKYLFDICSRRYGKYPNVNIFHGDSQEKLLEMLERIDGRALIWLDAHFSHGITSHGETESPIIKELELIKGHKRNDHCIIIDDLWGFGKESDYPAVKETERLLREINHDYVIKHENNSFRALPPKG